jgi:UDP-glucose 4-epimerase
VNPYGYTEIVVDRILQEVELAHGTKHVVLWYFNAAGADPDGDVSALHEPETHLIPLVLLAALSRILEVEIFGDHYPTPDGTCIRDYIHLSDLADAAGCGTGAAGDRRASHSFNLDNGNGFSVAGVVSTRQQVTGLPIRAKVRPRRVGDPSFDQRLARSEAATEIAS